MNKFQLQVLKDRALSTETAEKFGVRSITDHTELPDGCPTYWTTDAGYLPGLLIPWVADDGRTEYQLRPDVPPVNKNGRPQKYVTRSREDGFQPVLWMAKKGTADGIRLLVEGSCQTMAAATYAPEDVWVYGMLGCWGWSDDGTPMDLTFAEGYDVVIALDADMRSNVNVWDAGRELQKTLEHDGAVSVRFVELTGRKTGLDDFLAKREGRQAALARLIDSASTEKFPVSRRPKEPREESPGSEFFGDNGGLLVKVLYEEITGKYPCALTTEQKVAVYQNGVYGFNGLAFTTVITNLLGNSYRESHESAAHKFAMGQLAGDNRWLPDTIDRPLLNCRNGMVDLRTLELLPHDPSYLSGVQIPIEWNPDATCPTYERWLQEVIPDQIDDLEEVTSLMLDPTATPSKAVFLYGPSRSGKSTYLRLMQEVAGHANRSAVPLHTLVEDRFAAANLYGKILNIASDLPATYLEDISIFKLITGEDPIHGNRKYGGQFIFTNRALCAFSANTIPAVGEASSAYTNRMKPFRFDQSFAGRENANLEAEMRRELPGILARWVRAARRLRERGGHLGTPATIAGEFAERSDHVRRFVAECCTITGGQICPQTLPASQVTTTRELYAKFKERCAEENVKGVGALGKFKQSLTSINGVMEEVRTADRNRTRGHNVVVRPRQQWGLKEEPAGKAGSFEQPLPAVEKQKVDGAGEIIFPGSERGGPDLPALPAGHCPAGKSPAQSTSGVRATLTSAGSPVLPAPRVSNCQYCGGPRTLDTATLFVVCLACKTGDSVRRAA